MRNISLTSLNRGSAHDYASDIYFSSTVLLRTTILLKLYTLYTPRGADGDFLLRGSVPVLPFQREDQ